MGHFADDLCPAPCAPRYAFGCTSPFLYDVVEDYVRRRQPFRAEHLALAERFHREGKLLLGGAFAPADGALLVFRAASADEVEAFVREDPYVRAGLVTGWRVKAWTVVIGAPG